MDVPLIDIGDFVNDKAVIGTRLIARILKGLKFKDIQNVCSRKDQTAATHLEDEFTYENLFYSIEEDKTTHRYVLKQGPKTLLTCFEARKDRIAVRSVQQKLSDITTNFVITSLNDEHYKKLFIAFYKPMSKMLEMYCKYRKYSPDKDVVMYYKGGNVFRMILNDIINILGNEEYQRLLKRSDADFQIYINPDLPDVDKVREEISLLVVYVFHNVRLYIQKSGVLKVSDEKHFEKIKEQYIEELKNVGLKVANLKIKSKQAAVRKDFMMSVGKLSPDDDKEFMLLKKFDSIVEGLDGVSSTYFISRNTALDFSRKDNLKATFDLLRFRRNFKLEITLENGESYVVNAPFEVLDVSIPKGEDYGLTKLTDGNVQNLTRLYKYESKGAHKTTGKVVFRAPTVSYQINDLHDLLFKQNEYPWTDIKYQKRILRYFLSLVVYEIVEKLGGDLSVREVIRNIHVSFERFAEYLCCEEQGRKCSFDLDTNTVTYVRKFYSEYKTLVLKVNNLQNEEEKQKEFRNLKKFTKSIREMFLKLMRELIKVEKTINDDVEKQLMKIHQSLNAYGQTEVL